MTLLYLDVETIPTQREDMRDRLHSDALEAARTDPPPANYKKPEAVDKWRAERIEHAPKVADEAHHATGLEPGYGELACICWAWADEPIQEAVRSHLDSEADVLRLFFSDLRDRVRGGIKGGVEWCGFNVGFDLRYLHHRAVVLGIPPPVKIPHLEPPWRERYVDLQYEWWGARPGKGSSLKTLCDMLGIDVSADDIDGSQVWAAWQDGRIEAIVEHCRRDVERVREIHRRLTWASE